MKNIKNNLTAGVVGLLMLIGVGCNNKSQDQIKKAIFLCEEGYYCWNDEGKYKILVPVDTNFDLKYDIDLVFPSPSSEIQKINNFYNANKKPNYILIEYFKNKEGKKTIKNLKVYKSQN